MNKSRVSYLVSSSSRQPGGDLAGRGRDLERALLLPDAGVRGAVPALQADRHHLLALVLVEQVGERLDVPLADLGGRPADEEQGLAAVLELGHGAPALGLAFGGIEHGVTLLGRETGCQWEG